MTHYITTSPLCQLLIYCFLCGNDNITTNYILTYQINKMLIHFGLIRALFPANCGFGHRQRSSFLIGRHHARVEAKNHRNERNPSHSETSSLATDEASIVSDRVLILIASRDCTLVFIRLTI